MVEIQGITYIVHPAEGGLVKRVNRVHIWPCVYSPVPAPWRWRKSRVWICQDPGNRLRKSGRWSSFGGGASKKLEHQYNQCPPLTQLNPCHFCYTTNLNQKSQKLNLSLSERQCLHLLHRKAGDIMQGSTHHEPMSMSPTVVSQIASLGTVFFREAVKELSLSFITKPSLMTLTPKQGRVQPGGT